MSGTQGTFRFWFEPTTWASASTANGKGPGNVATLLELDAIGKNQSANVFTLQVSADGTTLSLVALSDSNPSVLVQSEINWQTNQSHLIVLNYSQKETDLFIDGQLLQQGSGTVEVPPQVAALFVGSSLAGDSVAGGDFDELSCFGPLSKSRFSRPLTAMDISFYYNALAEMAALGPISAEEIAARQKRIAEMKAQRTLAKSAFSLDGGGMEAMAMRGTYGPLAKPPLMTQMRPIPFPLVTSARFCGV